MTCSRDARPPLLLPALLMALTSASAQNDDAFFEVGEVSVPDESGSALRFRYRLLPPVAIVADQTYPILLFLHGAGERGVDNERQLTHLPRLLASAEGRKRFDGYVLAPQCRVGHRWVEVPWDARGSTPRAARPTADLAAAIAALESVVRTRPIDPNRVLATGLSMGGFGVLDLAVRQPERFAGVVPVCGGGDERSVSELVGLPLFFAHGARDRVVPPERSEALVSALRALGERPGTVEYPDVEHAAWGPAYAAGGPLDWLVSKTATLDSLPSRTLPWLRRVTESTASPGPIICLGDSITELGTRPDGYVSRLSEGLAGLTTRVVGAGVSGHRVPDLIERLDRDVLSKKPRAVFVYIGINDVWHFDHDRGTEEVPYRTGLTEIVRRIQSVGARVVVATPTVIGERWDGGGRHDARLDRYSQISLEVANATGAVPCPLRRLFLDTLAVRNSKLKDAGILTTDGVHLNAAGDALVAFAAAKSLAVALRE